MLVSAYRFIAGFGPAVFADPGMQRIDIDTEILGSLDNRLVRLVRQFNGWRSEFRTIDFLFFLIHFGHTFSVYLILNCVSGLV